MTYKITGKRMLFSISRADIISVSDDDVLQVEGFPGATHVWTKHDSEFVENNPYDDIYLEVERIGENKFRAVGIQLMNV